MTIRRSARSASTSMFLAVIFCSKDSRIWLAISEKSKGTGLMMSSPDWILAAASMLMVMRDRRLTSSEMMCRYFFCWSCGIVPSSIPSTKPLMVVMGVLNSCETLPIKPWVSSSSCSRSRAMLLNEVASSSISSQWLSSGTRTLKSPAANSFAAFAMVLSGRVMRLDRK